MEPRGMTGTGGTSGTGGTGGTGGTSGEEPPQYVVAHVRDWLADDERVAALDIRVRIMGRKVFLTGSVPTEARRTVVTDVVAAHLPDHEIHNELAVAECSEASPQEVETLQ